MFWVTIYLLLSNVCFLIYSTACTSFSVSYICYYWSNIKLYLLLILQEVITTNTIQEEWSWLFVCGSRSWWMLFILGKLWLGNVWNYDYFLKLSWSWGTYFEVSMELGKILLLQKKQNLSLFFFTRNCILILLGN